LIFTDQYRCYAWLFSSRTWDAVIAALPPSYRTVAPDLRGWGDSDAPVIGYALADFADDVQQMIATLGLRQYVLVIISLSVIARPARSTRYTR
jgi:pimeloyl-ACP methyl ester carboxylesterase